MRRVAATPRRLRGASAWRSLARRCAAAAILFGAAISSAQSPAENDAAATRATRLIVWIVAPHDPRPQFRRNVEPPQAGPATSPEQTAGSFGQTASSVGQTAGSTGQTAGSFGQTSSSTGQTAGSAGQTAGSFGQTSSSVGQNAGDAGQTAGSFGTSGSNLAQVAAASNGSLNGVQQPKRDPHWDPLVRNIQFALPKFDITFVDIYTSDLQAQLEATAGTADAPDILLGNPLPPEWSRQAGLAQRFGIAALWTAWNVPQTDHIPAVEPIEEDAVLATAPNPAGAQAFAAWFSDRGSVAAEVARTPDTDAIVQVAVRAAAGLLVKGTVAADADPEMAEVSPQMAAAVLIKPGPPSQESPVVGAEVTGLRVFGSLAIVAVRAVGAGASTFGVAHSILVMRRDPRAGWKVLQVSPDLASQSQRRAWDTLVGFSEGSPVVRTEGTKVLGVSIAAPPDGDSRPAQPELWWDNLGGATLQIVEWQVGGQNRWSTSNLYFVPDNNGRLQTRVTARFAVAGQYRWRVWSMGGGGTVVLSPWRTFRIAGS